MVINSTTAATKKIWHEYLSELLIFSLNLMNNTKLVHSEHLVKVNVTHHSNARTRKFSIEYGNNKKYKQ